MKNLYLSLSLTMLALGTALAGSAQANPQSRILDRAHVATKATRQASGTTKDVSQLNASPFRLKSMRGASHVAPKVRWHQESDAGTELRGGGIPNDQCANAQVLTVNAPGACPGAAVAGNNGGADNDGGFPDCDVTDTAFEDVWYAFNSGTNTSITIDIVQGTIEDIIVEVLEGGCGGTPIHCDFSSLTYTITVTPGTDYVIRIGSNNDFGAGGTFDICLTGTGGGATPANDDCTGAVAQNLSVGSTLSFSGDNTGATEDGGTGFVMVWEAFTTTECANVAINYCVAGSEFTDFLVNLAIQCPDFITGVLTGASDGCTLTFTDLAAGTYYIPVLVDPALTPVGPYTIEVSATACGPVGPYCEAGASSVQFEKISNVTTAGINNNSTGTAGYEDFTGGTAGDMTAGQVYPVSVTIDGGYDTDEVLIWIDLDQSESFEPGELVFTSALGVGPHTGNIAIPGGTPAGSTRMRVRLHDTYTGPDYFNSPNPTPCDTSTFGQVEDYTVNISGGGPTPPNDDCTGAVAQDLSVGSTISFSGDNTGATEDGGTGFVMVWEAFTTTECADVVINYCVSGSEFTNFLVNLAVNCPDFITGVLTGASDGCTLTFTELPAGTYYIPVLVDPADTPIGPYTIEVSATACGPVGPYCEAGASSLQFEKISNVTFSNINNNSTSTAGYEDFTGVTGEVVAGVDYNISVTIDGGYDTDEVRAWIDYNQDQVFDDPAELVFTSALGVGPHAGTVSVPLTASQGTTRMRVRMHDTYTGPDYFNAPNPTPCDTSTFGQVEDYTIDVVGVITGVEEMTVSTFSVYPNPTNGNIDVVSSMAYALTVIDVLDMTGRLVYSEQRQLVRGERVHLPLAGTLAAGTYALRLSSEHGRAEQRFVVR